MDKERKIALVIKTEGLEYDDRVRKEILTVEKIYPNVKFKIFAMLPDNKEREGVTEYGTPYKAVYIPARDKYPSAQKVYLKAYQFYQAVKKDLDDFDAVWTANVDASFVPMLYRSKRIVWDLHELPMVYLSNGITRKLLKYIFGRCKIVIHANPQREQYLERRGVVSEAKKHFALRNFPNFNDIDKDYDDKYGSFVAWKGERRCVYLQGLDGDRRAAYESVSAVMHTEDMCAVVVGKYDEKSKERLKREYGDTLDERVLFIGRIPQMKIPQYVQQCFTTLVFYKNISPNNYYCEANRFYQSVLMGLPVVVGSNPPMKEIVEKYGFGVVLDDDGSDIQKISEGLQRVVENHEIYKHNIVKNRGEIVWDKNDATIKEIIEKLFEK